MAQRYDVGEVITAMVTPFNEDLTINYSHVEKLTEHLINNGTDALLVAATTGESPTLTHEEELELLKVVKSVAKNKAKIIASAGSNSTLTAVEQSKRVEATGCADAILSVVPYYNKPSQAGLVNHFTQIAKSVDLPVLLYNIPGRTGINMLPETIAAIAENNKNVFGVKQSNPDLEQVSEIIINSPADFSVFSGDDSLTLPMLSIGAKGVVSVASHIVGKEIKQMIRLFKLGKAHEAAALHLKLYPTFKKIFMTSNPVPIKAALEKKGLIFDEVRNPLVTLTEEQKEELFSVLQI